MQTMKGVMFSILAYQLVVVQCFPSKTLPQLQTTNVASLETLNLPHNDIQSQLYSAQINNIAAKPVGKSKNTDIPAKIPYLEETSDLLDQNGGLKRKLPQSPKSKLIRLGKSNGILQWVQGMQPLPFTATNPSYVPFANFAFTQNVNAAAIPPAWHQFTGPQSENPLLKATSLGKNGTKIWGEGTEYKFPYIVELLVQNIQKYYSNYVYTDSSRPPYNGSDKFEDSADFAPLPPPVMPVAASQASQPVVTTLPPQQLLPQELPPIPQTTKFIRPIIIPNAQPLPIVDVMPSIDPPYILVGDDD